MQIHSPQSQLAIGPSINKNGEAFNYTQYNLESDLSLSSLDEPTFFKTCQIGNTPLFRAQSLGSILSLKNLFLKLETENPSGTQKDRVAYAHVNDALKKGKTGITTATCGNYGVSLTHWATAAGLNVHIYIPINYHPERHISIMNELGAKITRTPGSYEDAVEYSTEFALHSGWYNANPGGENTEIQLQAYSQIAVEIVEELGDAPDFVAVPVSNGTTLAGIHMGFCLLHRKLVTSKIPRLLAASTRHCNPIIQSWIDRQSQYYPFTQPDTKTFIETEINEPLINIDSLDGVQAYSAIVESKGAASGFSDIEMIDMATLVSRLEDKEAMPAAASGLLILEQLRHQNIIIDSDIVTAVITGKGLTELVNAHSHKIKNDTKVFASAIDQQEFSGITR